MTPIFNDAFPKLLISRFVQISFMLVQNPLPFSFANIFNLTWISPEEKTTTTFLIYHYGRLVSIFGSSCRKFSISEIPLRKISFAFLVSEFRRWCPSKKVGSHRILLETDPLEEAEATDAAVVVIVSAVVVVHLAGDEFGRRERLRSEVALLQLKDAVTTGRMTVAWMELPFLKSVSKLILKQLIACNDFLVPPSTSISSHFKKKGIQPMTTSSTG